MGCSAESTKTYAFPYTKILPIQQRVGSRDAVVPPLAMHQAFSRARIEKAWLREARGLTRCGANCFSFTEFLRASLCGVGLSEVDGPNAEQLLDARVWQRGWEGTATCAYASRPAASIMRWTQCVQLQSPRNALRVAEISK